MYPSIRRRLLRITLWAGCLVLATSFLPSVARADTSASYDMVNHKLYGNCRAWTQQDMMTDAVSHHFECLEQTLTDLSSISIHSWSQTLLEVQVSKGVMFRRDGQIEVAIRIDKGPVIKRTGIWLGSHRAAILRDQYLARILMEDLAKGQRAVIQVGSERGNIKLEGSTAALQDFRLRMSQRPQSGTSVKTID